VSAANETLQSESTKKVSVNSGIDDKIGPIFTPFAARLDPLSGAVRPELVSGTRRLSAMTGLFSDEKALRRRVKVDDVVVYATSTAPVPSRESHVGFNQTRIEPGDVGGELFMTHGHIHVQDSAEVYIGQSGVGGILLSKGNDLAWVSMEPNVAGYIPPGWTHRSVNTGTEPFVFISFYPALSGQNYEPVRKYGLGARVMRTSSGYRVVAKSGDIIHES
jgi:glucose-6-phosphate isomerase